MHASRRSSLLSFLAAIVLISLSPPAARAQAEGATAAAPATSSSELSNSDRLFLAFIEDAAVIERQWWEGRAELLESDGLDVQLLRGVVAFQPWKAVEVGATMGFGSTDTPGGAPDGTGATDLDVWGKYRFGPAEAGTSIAAGGIATIPTGDDTAGLGNDAFSLAGFAAVRHRLPRWTVAAHAGLRINGDAQFLGGPTRDGEASVLFGLGGLVPVRQELTLVGEVWFESDRYQGADNDARVLGGVNWHVGQRGTIRGAVAFGLDDGAPDAQLIGGYAARF